jgi:DNA replication protein DnaC
MKRLSEIAAKITPSPDLRGQTSLSDNERSNFIQPVSINCHHPENPDEPCPVCRGMGVIKYDVPPDDRRFGKLFRCPNNPIEEDTDRQSRLRRISNLDAFRDKTLDNFRIRIPGYDIEYVRTLESLHTTIKAYAENPNGTWIVLEGSYGTGKTHLAAAIGNECLKRGEVVLFMTTPDLLDHLRSTYAPNSDTGYDELFDRVRNAQMLILDDLGTENPSEWAKEKLFQLLNHRYSHRLATVITTNADIDTLDPRLRSRLMDEVLVRRQIVDLPDYRNLTPNKLNQYDQEISRLSMYNHMKFNNFDVKTGTDANSKVREKLVVAAEYAYGFAQKSPDIHEPWLIFAGGYGSGKTHLAAAIAHYRQEHGQEVMFLTVPDLLDYIRTTFEPDSSVTFNKLFDRVRNVPLLVLDDLGAESAKPWAQEKLFQIIDYRYVAGLPTVITVAKEIEKLNQRVASRLIDPRVCAVVDMDVPSYGIRVKQSR